MHHNVAKKCQAELFLNVNASWGRSNLMKSSVADFAHEHYWSCCAQCNMAVIWHEEIAYCTFKVDSCVP